MQKRPLIYGIAMLVLLTACSQQPSLSQQLVTAWQQDQAFPLISQQRDINHAEAYRIQSEFNQQNPDTILGYKAGLTTPASQARFGVDSPVSGVLFGQPLNSGTDLPLPVGLFIELEIGFELARDINQALSDDESLTPYISSTFAAIELPRLRFPDISQLTGSDLIASNVGSYRMIRGPELTYQQVANLAELQARLYLDGELMDSGQGSAVMGSPLEALRWLINQQIAQGYSLKAGQVLITGALGNMTPGKAGNWTAEFGQGQVITFRLD